MNISLILYYWGFSLNLRRKNIRIKKEPIMKKTSLFVLAFSFLSVVGIESYAAPSQIQKACNTACGTDADCKGKCKAYCNGDTVCPQPSKTVKYPNADGQSYVQCLVAKCTKDAITGGASTGDTSDTSAS